MTQSRSYNILAIDDDRGFLESVKNILELHKYKATTISSPTNLKSELNQYNYDCALLDVRMPGVDGISLLKEIQLNFPKVPVIMVSGQSDIGVAVNAIKLGAYDFIEKPVDTERLIFSIRNAIKNRLVEEEKEQVTLELKEKYKMIYQSKSMKDIINKIETVAETNAKVFINGESGTGKELVAWAIHHYSDRRSKPYIKINCAAIPENLLESELFGHKKGTFTGAFENKVGKFEIGHEGTIFLDEIGDMGLGLQSKLLRVLEDAEIVPLGSNKGRKVDIRIISATNQHLEDKVKEGLFRKDLFHRLNVIKINIPPLRERIEDIIPLAIHFLKLYRDSYNKKVISFSENALEYMLNYDWPGNVRELKNIVEKLVVFSKDTEIKLDNIYEALESETNSNIKICSSSSKLKEAKELFEKEFILKTLEKTNWKIQETADLLGIDRTNLFKKMQRLGIKK